MIIADMESSGLDPEKHGLLSVGAVDFSDPQNTFYGECRLWDGGHVDDAALGVNGFTRDQINDPSKQSDGDLMRKFLEWSSTCPERTIGGQNPSSDRGFLRAAAHRSHLDWPFAYRTIDLHSVAYYHMTKRGVEIPALHGHSSLSLDKILVYVGMPPEPKPHNGLRGAKLEAEAFSRLFLDKPFFDEYREHAIPWLTD